MAGIRFDVPGYGSYLYDGLTNRIYTVRDSGAAMPDSFRQGMENIVWKESFQELRQNYESGLRSLVLQMTRDCNLRCSYCAYSGAFSNMLPHAREDMSPETLRRSIDFFMEHSAGSPEAVIIFYGGEPLLKFEDLKAAVEYAGRYGRKVRYGISSNGLLLTPRVLQWLAGAPDVCITITVNGNAHDSCRITAGGEGSLEGILRNLAFAREHYPGVWEKQIRLMANIISLEEIPELREFYARETGKLPVMVSQVCLDSCDPAVGSRFQTDAAEVRRVREKLRAEYVRGRDPFLGLLFEEGLEMIHNRGLYSEEMPGIISSCMPMSWRLFVRTDGTFNMCEKVSDGLNLGNLWEGFDEEKIHGLYDKMYEFARRNCRDCWAQRLCAYCYQDVVDGSGEVVDAFPPGRCERSREKILDYLKLYVQIAKQDPAG